MLYNIIKLCDISGVSPFLCVSSSWPTTTASSSTSETTSATASSGRIRIKRWPIDCRLHIVLNRLFENLITEQTTRDRCFATLQRSFVFVINHIEEWYFTRVALFLGRYVEFVNGVGQ